MAERPPDHDDGWAALAEGRWRDALAAYRHALDEAVVPEALEGLSWAAWWLDDEPAVFDARQRAYRLYRARGDAAGAARMATWLAADHLDFHGAAAVASGWLRRAERLLEALEPCPEHGWLAFHAGYRAHLAGETEAACAAGVDAARLGRRFGVADLEMLGLALEGAALVAAAQPESGMRCLDEATAIALEGDATIPISGAWACCFLVSACTSTRDHERAFSWCDRIADFAERYGSRYMLAFCRSEYGAVHLARGRWREAEAVLVASVEDFLESRPAWSVSPRAELAELRRRQGRHADALRLLEDVGPSVAAQLCRARIALDRGDRRRALELAERAHRQLSPGRPLDRLPVLEVLAHARIARGELEGAERAVDELQATARVVGTPALLGSARLAAGILSTARGDHESSRRLLEDAVDRFDSCPAPFEAAQARLALALSLAALGQAEAAATEAARAAEIMSQLGADGEAARAHSVHEAIVRPPRSPVTRREHEVLRLLAAGLTNRQIADRLVVSEHTVHRHVTNILRKLNLHSRTAAAAHAVRSGMVDEQR